MNETEKWMEEIARESLDLRQMNAMMDKSMYEILNNPERIKRRNQRIAEYKEKYGEKWLDYMFKDSCLGYDIDMKYINECIYYGRKPRISGEPHALSAFYKKVRERLQHIYGDDYQERRYHPEGEKETVRLLLEDAVKTGKWKELPDCLQNEYHNLVQGDEDMKDE